MHIFIKLKVFSFVSRDPLWWSSRGSIRAKSSGGKRNDQTNDNSTWKNRTHRCTVSEDEKSFPLENEKTKVTKEIIFCIASATAATLLFGAGLGPCKAYCVFCWGQRLLPDACVGVPTNEMKRNNENTKLGSGYIVHIIQWMRGKTLLFCLCDSCFSLLVLFSCLLKSVTDLFETSDMKHQFQHVSWGEEFVFHAGSWDF